MRHHNTVFHDLIKRIPWNTFDRLVDEHRSDHGVRRFDSRGHLIAMLYAQVSGARSLREIEAGLASQSARLHHLGASPAARSTLADANASRPAALYEQMFCAMAARASRATRRHMADAIRVLDATRIDLSKCCEGWATGAKDARAIKLHVAYDPRAEAPLAAETSSSLVNDITPAKAAEIEPGATYVFDLGYYSFDWWARLHGAGCRFVTRLKRNTALEEAETRPAPADPGLMSERTGFLPRRMTRTRQNPMQAKVREIEARTATGKTIRLVTNDFDAPAEEIAALYKDRWRIELFFKWIKQNLKIKRFIGASENAVRIQIFTALIAYLLLRAAHRAQTAIPAASTFARIVGETLFHRRRIDRLTQPPDPPQNDPRQTVMALQ